MDDPQCEARKSGRFSIYVFVVCRFRDGGSERIRVRNLSELGLGGQLEGDRETEQGQPISLAFRGMEPVDGRIAWVDGRNIGIAFASPIEPSRVLSGLSSRGND